MTNDLDILSASPQATLLTFTWGSHTARYCVWTEDLVLADGTFTAVPAVEIELGKEYGGLRDETTKIIMPISYPPFNTVTNGQPHAYIYASVEEILPGDETTRRTLISGELTAIRSNANGQPGLVELQLSTLKERLNADIGLLCDSYCFWTFGDSRCGVTVPTYSGSVSAITNNYLTVLGLPTADTRWHRGFVEYDGLRILIRKYSAGNVIELLRTPPPSWLNKTVVIYAGCDKTIESCKTLWDNETQFMGVGTAMPNYHPMTENPSDA